MASATSCPPRFATPRTPSRRTLGEVAARIARELGTPLMPWQRQFLDVALELDDAGRLTYREVILLTPRQSGKTTAELVAILTRALAAPAQSIRYTAQSGVQARKKLVDDWLPLLKRSRFAGQLAVRLVNGHESVSFRNGSRLGLVTATRRSGHGDTVDMGLIDEAFALADARLEQALKPSMMTRPAPQLWVVSTAGVPGEAPYLWGKVEAGRQLAEASTRSGVCYFEWSADDDADPSNPETWHSCMPALGHTVTEDAVAADFRSMDVREFERAYLNRWVTSTGSPAIPLDAWHALEEARSSALDPVALGVDVAPDRSWGAVCAAGRRSDGLAHLELVDRRQGTSWVAGRLAELERRHRPSAIVLDAAGPAASLLPELERLRVRRMVVTTARDYARACEALHDAVAAGMVRHLGQAELAAALDGARRRPLGDAWALARRSSSCDISPAVAAALALWGLIAHRAPRGQIMSGREALSGPLDEGELEQLEAEAEAMRAEREQALEAAMALLRDA